MSLNKARLRRRKDGVCVRCGADSGGRRLCDAHQAEANEYARERYAAMKAAGVCARCGGRLKPDHSCGVCNYAQRVRWRGGTLQGLRDGSAVRKAPCSATATRST